MPQDKMDIDAIAAQRATRRSPAKWTVVIAILLAAGFGGWWYLSRTDDKAVAYRTAPAATTTLTVTVTATGTVEPTNLVEISSELSGTIRTVEVDFNAKVAKGQVLARLDTQKLEAAVEHSRAMLSAKTALLGQAQTNLDEARRNFDRIGALSKRGVASEQDYLTATSAFARANAAFKVAQADIRVATADLEVNEATLIKACICSPIDGVVLKRSVDVGQTVAASLQAPILFTIAEDLRVMELRVDIDEADIGKVKIGDAAEFGVEAYQERLFPAKIADVRYAPETVDGVVTYKAILAVDNADLLLRPGMTATATITVSRLDDVLAVPNAALRFSPREDVAASSGGGLLGLIFRPPSTPKKQVTSEADPTLRTLWKLVSGKPEAVQVKVGQTDGTATHIVSGELKPGDPVIVEEGP